MNTSIKRPALRYHGGKWRLAPWIIKYIPDHDTYVEPYGGGASVLLRKERSRAEVYNDLDGDVVNVFRQLRDNGSELRELLRLTPFSRAEFKHSHEPTDSDLERARRIIVRSFMGIGTDAIRRMSNGFRGDSTRNCAADWVSYEKNVDLLIERLRGVIIEQRNALQVIESHDTEHTLFYVDPPYVASTRTSTHGYSYEMTDEDHIKLSHVLKEVKGKVILSGYPSSLYEELYKDWYRTERPHRAFFGIKRTEVIWTNFLQEGVDNV